MSSIVEWFKRIPRNAQLSVQRLTFYGWLRLIVIVAVYILLIRPWLMKLAEKSQVAAHEKVVTTSAMGPNVLRGHAKASEGEDTDEDTDGGKGSETSKTSSWSEGPKARKRQKQAVEEAVEKELQKAEDDDEDADVEFLKKYHDDHDFKMSRPQDIYFDYNARQQYLRDQARAPSRRPRKRWPPLPKAEDEVISLAQEFKPGPPDAGGREARSRGALDQQPIILDADPQIPRTKPPPPPSLNIEKGKKHSYSSIRWASTSSGESSEPETPIDLDSEYESKNRDRRYVFIPKEGVEIPLTYDEPRTPIHAKPPEPHAQANPERGRVSIPKLDTNLPRAKSSYDVPFRLERERSPYTSVSKHRQAPVSGDSLLSPEAMTPKPKYQETHAHPSMQSQRTPMTAIHNLGGHSSEHDPKYTRRPSMIRQRSAMAYPGEGTGAVKSPEHNPLRHENFHPLRRDGLRLEPNTPVSPRRSSAVPSPTLSARTLPSDNYLRQSSVPPPRAPPVSTGDAPSPSVPPSGFTGQQSLNALLASPVTDRRRASPRNSPRTSPQASPSSSPLSSPPRTPSTEASNRKFSYRESIGTSGSNSRPASHLSPQQSRNVDDLNRSGADDRHTRPAIRSRQTSPLPPAASGYLEASLAPRIDIRSSSPAVRGRSSSHAGEDEESRSQHPKLPSDNSAPSAPRQTLKPGNVEHRRRSSSAVDNRPCLTVDPSRSQDTAEASKPRYLSLKTPTLTRAASVGASPATLPPCPRSAPVAGYNDWYSLYDYPQFKICPSCRDAVSDAGYGRHLTATFTKSPEQFVRCSFGIPWIRMAYLLMIKKRRSDVDLLYDMADVAEETPPCPGKIPAARDWYRIHDMDSDRSVPGFYACPYCVRSLETIFPALKGVFHKTRNNSRHSLEERTCSLRSDSSRFPTYVDLLEDTAKQATEYRREPNTYRFVELAKTIGAIPKCARDAMLRGKSWHMIPKLPEFTVCPECYEDIVWPAVLQGLPLASHCSKTPQAVGNSQGVVSCQMYSTKMRKVFIQACEDNDFEYLRKMALRRYRVERDLQAMIVEAQQMSRAEREEAMEEIVDEWADWD
ncbi:MAG: hypothetical protein Q9213_006376 [Squamulea squamosa]